MKGRGVGLWPRALVLVAIMLMAFLIIATPDISGKRGKPVPCPLVIGFSTTGPIGMTSPLVLASPCPGNALSFDASNIVTLDNHVIRLWQYRGSQYDMTWISEGTSRYSDVIIGDPDNDQKREIVAFAYCTVTTGKGKLRHTEDRVWLEVYEGGSTGLPTATSEYFVLDRFGWSTDGLIGDVDGDGRNEIIAVATNRLVIFEYIDGQYTIEFESLPVDVVLNSGDIGNVDDDDDLEIITGTNQGTVYVWNRATDGSWSYIVYGGATSPYLYVTRVGNVVGDSKPEIVSVTSDISTHETFIFVWGWGTAGSFGLLDSDVHDFDGTAVGSGFDLSDLDADGVNELVLGMTGAYDPVNNHAAVLSFTFNEILEEWEWEIIWEVSNRAVSSPLVGDADGVPGTELVYTGMWRSEKSGDKTQGTLYIEVFAWDVGTVSGQSMWKFSGDYSESSGADLG